MTDREALIKEINELSDFIIKQVFDIVHYMKLGIENEYVSKSNNEFYNSRGFRNIVSESIVEYQGGKTEAMDIS